MADVSLGTATLRTQIDTAGLRDGLQVAEREIDEFASENSTRLESVGGSLGRGLLTAGVAIAGIGAGLFTAANAVAAYGDEIDKLSIRTRLGTDTLQELRFVADQVGVPFTAIEANIRAFSGRLAEVERGGATVVATFERLGVSLRDDAGELRNTEELFLDTLGALSGIENETQRAALAVQAFGEQGSALLPFLAAGPAAIQELRDRAKELGLVLSPADIARLVEYKDSVSEIQQTFAATGRTLVIELLPALETLVPLVRDGLVPAARALSAILTSEGFKNLGQFAGDIRNAKGAFEELFTEFEAGAPIAETLGARLERLAIAVRDVNPFTRGQDAQNEAVTGGIVERFGPAPQATPNALWPTLRAGDPLQAYVAGLQTTLNAITASAEAAGEDPALAQIALVDQAVADARDEFTGVFLERLLEYLQELRQGIVDSLGSLSPAQRLALLESALASLGVGATQTVNVGASTDAPPAAVSGGAGALVVAAADAAAETKAAAEGAAALTSQASERFALAVINSAQGFASAITAFSRGDAGAGISGLGSSLSGIIGTINPLAGAILGAVTGIFGGLISAGQSQRDQDRVRASGVGPRGAPAIEFNINVQQSLNVQSLTDPASRAAVNGLLNETVTRITRVIESNLIPRIQRLEAAA